MSKVTNINTRLRRTKKKPIAKKTKPPVKKKTAKPKTCGVVLKVCSNTKCKHRFKNSTQKWCPSCNTKRRTCNHAAGKLTTHPGVGPCYLHGGIRRKGLKETGVGDRGGYTEDSKADTLIRLIMNRGNIAKTSRDTGIDPKTIRYWRNEDPEHFRQFANMIKSDVADVCLRVAKKSLEKILKLIPSSDKIPDLVKALATAVDKAQLLTGGATGRTEHGKTTTTPIEGLSDEELEAEARALEEEERNTA